MAVGVFVASLGALFPTLRSPCQTLTWTVPPALLLIFPPVLPIEPARFGGRDREKDGRGEPKASAAITGTILNRAERERGRSLFVSILEIASPSLISPPSKRAAAILTLYLPHNTPGKDLISCRVRRSLLALSLFVQAPSRSTFREHLAE